MPNNSDNGSIQPWQLAGSVPAETGRSKYTYSVAGGLQPGQGYNFRVDVVGAEFDKPIAQVSSGTSSDVILNDCTSM